MFRWVGLCALDHTAETAVPQGGATGRCHSVVSWSGGTAGGTPSNFVSVLSGPGASGDACDLSLLAARQFGAGDFQGLLEIVDLEDADRPAAGRAGGHVGVLDADTPAVQPPAQVGQRTRSIGHVDGQDFGLRHGDVDCAEDLASLLDVLGNEAEDAVLDRVHQGHCDDVDLVCGKLITDPGQDPGLTDEEDGELSHGFVHDALPQKRRQGPGEVGGPLPVGYYSGGRAPGEEALGGGGEPQMASVRFAFIGPTREASPWLLQALARVGTLEAICDEYAEQDAAKHHARWAFSDAAAMLAEAEPDGVVIHRPLGDRARLIKQSLAAGAGVLLTGTPGSAATCQRMGTFSKLSGRFVLAAPALRYAPAVLLARRLIESGKLGAPISMTLQSTRRGAARMNADDHGAVPSDQVFEAMDLVHHLIGPIQQTFAVAHSDGALVASVMTSPGVPVSLVFHASGPSSAVGVEVEIRASDGSWLRIDRNLGLSCGNGNRIDAAHQVALGAVDPAVELGFEGLVAEFRRYIEAGRAGVGLVGPVAQVMAATEAVLASAARGRAIVPKPAKTAAKTQAVDAAAGPT